MNSFPPYSAGADDVQPALHHLLVLMDSNFSLRPASTPGGGIHHLLLLLLLLHFTLHTSLGMRRFRAIHPGFYAKNHRTLLDLTNHLSDSIRTMNTTSRNSG